MYGMCTQCIGAVIVHDVFSQIYGVYEHNGYLHILTLRELSTWYIYVKTDVIYRNDNKVVFALSIQHNAEDLQLAEKPPNL